MTKSTQKKLTLKTDTESKQNKTINHLTIDQQNKDDKVSVIFQKRHIRNQTASSWIMVIITMLGLFFIWSEFNQLKKQNELMQDQNESLRQSVVQTYRPLGMVNLNWDDKTSPMNIKIIKKDYPHILSFDFSAEIKNFGRGVLIYLGSISYITSDNVIDFKEDLLLKRINRILIDKKENDLRGEVLRPNSEDIQKIYNKFEKLRESDSYYCYFIFFYTDQDGNLYDTQSTFKVPIQISQNPQNQIGLLLKEKYGSYTPKERNEMYSVLKDFNQEFAEVIH